jgi:uncharacterized damage-inducible protein DinB
MITLKEIQLIYDYYYWANHKILSQTALVTLEQFIAPASFPYGGLRGTLVHLVEAENGWLSRMKGLGEGPEFDPQDFPTFAHLEQCMAAEENAMRLYLSGLSDSDLQGHVRYILPDGRRDRILWRCLYHLANHGTQHRAEAAALLTEYDHSPGDIDFNVFLDETGRQ